MAESNRPEEAIGIICGTGLTDGLEGLTEVRVLSRNTPFGRSSGMMEGRLYGRRVVVLFRHDGDFPLLPDEVNYAANAYKLKEEGVTRVLAFTAVGSLKEEFAPTHFLFPLQFLDRATGRQRTFFGGGIVVHTSGAHLVCEQLAGQMFRAAKEVGIPTPARPGGWLVTIPGPQFSSRPECEEFQKLGCDAVGMTSATEGKFIQLAEMCYASVAMSTDYDCWHQGSEDVSVEMVLGYMGTNAVSARKLVEELFRNHVHLLDRSCQCALALDKAVQSDLRRAPAEKLAQCQLLLERYLAAHPLGQKEE